MEKKDWDKAPESYEAYTQGSLGTWKLFVIKAIQNVLTNFYGTNYNHMTSTPTGCLAALVKGSTNPRALKYKCKRQVIYKPVDGTSQVQQWKRSA